MLSQPNSELNGLALLFEPANDTFCSNQSPVLRRSIACVMCVYYLCIRYAFLSNTNQICKHMEIIFIVKLNLTFNSLPYIPLNTCVMLKLRIPINYSQYVYEKCATQRESVHNLFRNETKQKSFKRAVFE